MKEDAIQKVGADAPSWLVEVSAEDKSLEKVKEARRLQRLKIAQGNSSAAKALMREVGEGSVVFSSDKSLVATAGNPFLVVPLFHFREYCKWKDRKDDSEGFIFDRTFDKESVLALRAKDKKSRFEPYGEPGEDGKPKFTARYVEHLIFPAVLYPAMTPVTFSFERGEFVQGLNFCNAILNRKVGSNTAPLFSQVWALRSEEHSWAGNNWWGFGFNAPAEGSPFVTQEEYPLMKKLHEELAEDYRRKALLVERDDEFGEYEEVAADDEEL